MADETTRMLASLKRAETDSEVREILGPDWCPVGVPTALARLVDEACGVGTHDEEPG